ncbi:hypothetical protein JAN5088_02276 [Jannaschia rubra]|uniref:Uncharacterized protein n=1 Tax=Jannaschia rubra TaxID=282197 RepID=A0A0M6XU78_9RHOB|nr:hypothetical protein JAN5088_02276 [Jannaschia rubra]
MLDTTPFTTRNGRTISGTVMGLRNLALPQAPA